MGQVRAGDVVALADESGNRYLLKAEAGALRVRGVGVIDPGKLEGLPYGSSLEHGNKRFRVLPPGYADLARGIRRKAQIILPKDAARILYECDVRAGKKVLESGIGSAALTTALARAVSPGGRVVTYELREDFAQWGRENLENAGVAEAVDVRLSDVTEGVDEGDFDAAVLDIPNPWDALPRVADALKPGGFLCCYSPLVSQVENTRRALASGPFAEARTLEILEREWVVGERGSRPDFDVLGHTGFLTFARRILP